MSVHRQRWEGGRGECRREKELSDFADYIMYSTFLTSSTGSVLFSRSDLLKRKDLFLQSIRPSLRHEKHRSFLFSRLDLLNRTDPVETVRNVEYMM